MTLPKVESSSSSTSRVQTQLPGVSKVALPVSLAEHKARIHGVKVPFHFPARSLVGQRGSQYTLPYSPLSPALWQRCPTKGTKTSHLLDKQPGMAGPPQQRWLLQSMFKYGLQSWTQRSSH